MTKPEVVDIVKKSLVKILVVDKNSNNVKSQGSGVIINDFGFVLTAYHVVSSLASDRSRIALILPYCNNNSFINSFMYGGLTFNIPENIMKPLSIDLAILIPSSPINIPAISLSQDIPVEGTEVIMAGFPEDLKTPLDFSENFNKDAFNKKDIDEIRKYSHFFNRWIMVKHGIIGGTYYINLGNNGSDLLDPSIRFSIQAAEYWVDNTYAPGASGGPVVDMNGRLIGIITERGEINESVDFVDTISFTVPSGTVRVLSHKLITWSLQELEKSWKCGELASANDLNQ